MSILKKFAAPLVAVALVAAMGVSLLANTGTAHAVVLAGTVAGAGVVTPTTGAIVHSSSTLKVASSLVGGNITVTEPAGVTWTATDTVVLTHAGYTFSGTTATMTGAGTATFTEAAGTTTISFAGVDGVAANDVITITNVTGLAATGVADGTVIAAVAAGAQNIAVTSNTAKRMLLGTSTSTTAPNPASLATPTYSADTAAAGGGICAYVADAAGVAAGGVPIVFTVSLGVVSTGSSKSATALTAPAGTACTNYRGGGGIASTDTAIASNSSINQVATLSITLTSPTGNTASKLAITAPTALAVSPTQTNVSPGYVSTTPATNLSVQVTDSAGLGVNGQVLLITTDKGALVNGFFQTCGTSKAVTSTSASLALTFGGEVKAGVVQLTYCGNQTDAAGQATVTAQNISTSMANVTTTVATAGRPAKVTATYANGSIAATVVDAAGNNVADGTPVQFTISANAGAVSNACTTTTNGKASSAVSLNTGSGTVIVTASYNESGLMAGCTAAAIVAPVVGTSFAAGNTGPGSQSISTVVNIGTVVTPPSTGGTGGGFAAAPVYSASKLAQAVFNGGTVADLEKAVVDAKGTGVWAQDSKGVFVLYIVNGGFVNDAFKAAFPTGFAGVTAVTVVGQ